MVKKLFIIDTGKPLYLPSVPITHLTSIKYLIKFLDAGYHIKGNLGRE